MMITKLLHILLITINLLYCLIFLFTGDGLGLVLGALAWMILFYTLLRYNQTIFLGILVLPVVFLSALLFLVFFLTYLLSGISNSSNQIGNATVTVVGMFYSFSNPLLSLIIIIRKNRGNRLA
jgi:heme/copper-type cytochrome/quinol oxidase subunit 2